MAGLLDPAHLGMAESGASTSAHGKLEEPDHSSTNWYFTRDEIEKNSPSRKDGIDLKKETYFRKSYCTFLQDLGMRLRLPQVTIATAIVFCHRFFHRQSHGKNDRYTIATACMFLAGKVEETPRPLKDVIIISYEIRNKKDPEAVQRIRQKDVYEQQKELTLLGERVVLATLGFDLNVHHPYKPLVAAIKKFKVAQNALAQVAWNFVNDGLRTSLCLQFKPHHIAAGAIFLAAKFLKVKLPSDGEVVWWQEFDVTPLQLEEISNQMLELYEQNKVAPPAHGSEIGGSSGMNINQNLGNSQSCTEAAHPTNGNPQYPKCGSSSHALPEPTGIAGYGMNMGASNSATAGKYMSASHGKQNKMPYEDTHQLNNSQEDLDLVANTRGQGKADGVDNKRNLNKLKHSDENDSGTSMDNERKEPLGSRSGVEEGECGKRGDESKGKLAFEDSKGKNSWIGLEEVKAALAKRRKSQGEKVDPQPTKVKCDPIDEDDLIERELESGIEAAPKAEKLKQDRRERAKLLCRPEQENLQTIKEQREENENGRKRKKSNSESLFEKRAMSCDQDFAEGDQERDTRDTLYDCTEEGELPTLNEQMQSPRVADDQLPASKQLENGASPVKRHDYGSREQVGQRDGSHENKYRHGNHHHHHSSHQQQHRGDPERERHHHKDREKQERDYKKSRHDHGK